MVLTEREEKMLETLYYTKGETLGRDLLYEAVVKAHPDDANHNRHEVSKKHPSRRDVMEWLKKQYIYQRYLVPNKSGGISSFVPRSPLHSLSADLIDLNNKPTFKNYKYILVVVDNFSRYMWARAITGKTADKVAAAMKTVLDDIKKEHPTRFTAKKHPIKFIQTDDGPEFKGAYMKLLKQFKAVASDNDYSPIKQEKTLAYQPQSNSLVERANGKLKSLIFKNLEINGGDWYKSLDKSIKIYNGYTNRSIGLPPKDAIVLDAAGQKKVRVRVKKIAIENKTAKPPNLKLGQRVRVKIGKNQLDKAMSAPNWKAGEEKITKVIVGRGVRPTKYHVSGAAQKDKLFTITDLQPIPAEVEYPPANAARERSADAPGLRRSTRQQQNVVNTAPNLRPRRAQGRGRARAQAQGRGRARTTARVIATPITSAVALPVGANTKVEATVNNIYNVQRILAHRGRANTRQIKVRWMGYGPQWDTWEPAKNFKNNSVWLEYKNDNDL